METYFIENTRMNELGLEITMLIVSIVTLVITGFATGISAFQLKKINDEKKNVSTNIRKLYVQKIKINKKNIESNLNRFENTIERLTNGKEDRKNYLKNINCLSYYITSINNKKFEEILEDLIVDAEDFIKVSIDTKSSGLNNVFELHADLKELLSIIENGNYIIQIMFKDFDKGLSEDYKRIMFAEQMEISLYQYPNITNFYKKIDSKITNNVLYRPPGNQSILTFATPQMYYGRQIATIQKNLGIYGNNDIQDIPYISINEPSEKGDFKTLMNTLNIENTLNLLNSIIKRIDFMVKQN